MTNIDKFEKICRFCGFEKNVGKFLFSSEAVKIGLLSKIKQLFPEEIELINTEVVLPKFICDSCEMTINYFFEFYNSVKSVQETLRKKTKSDKAATINHSNEHFCGATRKHSIDTVSISANGAITCAGCDAKLERNAVRSSVDRRVLCVCNDCGYKDELGLFENKKTDNLNCPRCVYSRSKKGAPPEEANIRAKKENTGYKCDVCVKVFHLKGHLNRHRLTHFGAKPYLCENCGAEFNQRSTLKTHTLIHKNSTPFSCKWCGQHFRHKQTLSTHVMSIHGCIADVGTLYECDNCKKKFVNRWKLRRHYRTHSGEKPFECDVCGKTFTQNVNLKTHYKKHENETKYASLALYSSQTLLNDAEEGKLIRELFTDCEQLDLNLDHISSSPNETNAAAGYSSSKIPDEFATRDATSLPLKTSANSSDMFYDMSSSSYMIYSNDSELYESKTPILPTFSSLNSVT